MSVLQGLTRRGFLAAAGVTIGGGLLASCERKQAGAGSGAGSLTLYCSADSVYAEPIIAEFARRTGVRVDPVFDTEATKTTGLVNRLLSEKDRPRCDVWWSSEPFGTIRLARAGVLTAYTSAAAEASMAQATPAGWPERLRAGDRTWYGFGSRARVIVYNTRAIPSAQPPRTLQDLCDGALKGRIGIARPQFGTTRGHMAAIVAARGGSALEKWLTAAKANSLRLYDGNASVVRAVGTGEIHAGLTDTDDVFAGQREGWPVELVYEAPGEQAVGTLVLPNTVALVRAGPAGTAAAGALADFLLSTDVQRMLAQSESHNMPVDPALVREFARFGPGADKLAPVELPAVADSVDAAMEICGRVLG